MIWTTEYQLDWLGIGIAHKFSLVFYFILALSDWICYTMYSVVGVLVFCGVVLRRIE